ncbi:M16 family metallopeptidase [Xylocopilactobacillus apicola]|uniref:Peptidase M16 n=1 Tax=Xylocopilactobacillus apicola TaxID=2932184 RepID=A0AAU9CXU1_9LACO|nr:pitrilysin family protein [Xylocopilactobacillus apicola]BDR58829.1 peptidase M16 [Xylocopilactobacillus apicola]
MDLISENKVSIERLANGLTVKLIEKPNFQVFNVQLIVGFGSSDSKVYKNEVFPGAAHLMEHLLFHKRDCEIDSLFSQLGIEINAYTTYNSTNFFYPFLNNQRGDFSQALVYLFKLVFDPYFTDELIKKETQIIESEIKITEDDTDSDLYTELLKKLFPKTPLSYDILGTTKTIKQSTVDLLEEIHHNFYRPENTVLYVCGPISLNRLLEIVNSIPLVTPKEQLVENSCYYYEPTLDCDLPPMNRLTKLVYGWSLPDLNLDYESSLIFSLFLENMLGKRSQFFHRMYNEGVINDDFYYEFMVEKNFTVIFFSCLTEFPTKIIQNTKETLHSIQISEEKFAITVKNFIGKYIQSFDSVEELGTLENDGKFHLEDAINSLKIVDRLTVERVKEVANKILNEAEFATAWKLIS